MANCPPQRHWTVHSLHQEFSCLPPLWWEIVHLITEMIKIAPCRPRYTPQVRWVLCSCSVLALLKDDKSIYLLTYLLACSGPKYRRNNIIGSGRPSFYNPVTNPLGQVLSIFILAGWWIVSPSPGQILQIFFGYFGRINFFCHLFSVRWFNIFFKETMMK